MEETSQNELEQMKKFEMLRRLGTAILLRRLWIPIVVFLVAFAALFVVIGRRAQFAERFEAHAVLFFRPRTTEHARAASNDEVIQILLRRSLKEKVADKIVGGEATEGFRGTMARVAEFRVDERSLGVFYVVARATTAADALKRANTYADVCLEEYALYRNGDLDVLFKTAEESKAEILKRLKEIDVEEDELNRKTRFAQPKQELARLNDAILRQKTSLSEANVRLAREAAQARKTEGDLAIYPKDLVAAIDTVKDLLSDLDKARTDVADAESRYTERNPKLVVAHERLATLRARVEALCRKHGIDTIDAITVEKIESLVKELAATKAQVELAQETTEALEAEIKKNDDEVKRLQELAPAYERLQRRRDGFNASLAEIEDTLSDLRYQRSAIPHDLTIVEPVRVPDETPPMTPKKMILMVMIAGVFAGASLFFAFVWEILFGRVYDVKELTYYPDLVTLGALPPDDVPFPSEHDEKRVMDGLYYALRPGLDSARLLFVARLPGGDYARRFHTAVEWNCAMCGKRLLFVEFVVSRDFTMTDEMKPIGGGLVLFHSRAYFPVNDISRLSPSELTLLETDLKTLAKTYDLFVLGRDLPVSDSSIFFEQMATLCDVVEIFVGKGRTSRHALRQALKIQKECGKPLYAVLSGETNWKTIQGRVR